MFIRDLILVINRLFVRIHMLPWVEIWTWIALHLLLPGAIGFVFEMFAQIGLHGEWSWKVFVAGWLASYVWAVQRGWEKLVWWADAPYRKARFVQSQLEHEAMRKR